MSTTDTDLLQAYVRDHDEDAFRELMERHAGMVFAICRQILTPSDLAEDAMHATFLTLARKAASLSRHGSLAGWLHRVAFRLALDTKKAEARRKQREEEAVQMRTKHHAQNPTTLDHVTLLHTTVDGLPEKLRLPIVLHDLEGMLQKDAAAALGCSLDAFAQRLRRGREALRQRLVRHGIAMTLAALVVLLKECASAGELPATLMSATMEDVRAFVHGTATSTSGISARVTALSERSMQMLLWIQVKTAAGVALCTIGAFALFGSGLMALDTLSETASESAGVRKTGQVKEETPKEQTFTGLVIVKTEKDDKNKEATSVTLKTWMRDKDGKHKEVLHQVVMNDQGEKLAKLNGKYVEAKGTTKQGENSSILTVTSFKVVETS